MASNSNISVRKNIVNHDVNDVIFRGVSSFINQKGVWTGTMTELTTSLNRVLSRSQRSVLPKSPAALRVVINRVVNRLRNSGISVKFGRSTDHNRTRFVKFTL